jgi:hypothetical protein
MKIAARDVLGRSALLLAALALPLAACSSPAAVSSTVPSTTMAGSSAPATGASAPASSTATVSPTPASPKPSATTSASGYTMADVRTHASAASCWSVVNGTVYDLTKWVNRHPGGRARIVGMCGKDATRAYRGEHGNESRPADILAGYKLGKLA